MKLEFNLNPAIPVMEIMDSMQLDSNQTIAHMKVDDVDLTLEIRGDVRVQWNPEPNGPYEKGQVYKNASDFPEELLKVFAEHKDVSIMRNINVVDNNWFEIFVEKHGETIDSIVADIPSLRPVVVFRSLWQTYLDYKD